MVADPRLADGLREGKPFPPRGDRRWPFLVWMLAAWSSLCSAPPSLAWRTGGTSTWCTGHRLPPYTDESACYRAVDELKRVAPKAAKVVQEADGHWRWVVSDDQGLPLAESPPLFRGADSCARAFDELHDELSAVLSR